MGLPEKLKTARKYLGKTQAEMGDVLDMSGGGWQMYERGLRVPGGQVFEALANLGFNVNWFFTEDDSEPMLRGEAARAEQPLPLDKDLMREIIIGLDPIFESLAKPWPGEKKAQLMLLLHDEVLKGEMEGKEVAKTALRLIKLAS